MFQSSPLIAEGRNKLAELKAQYLGMFQSSPLIAEGRNVACSGYLMTGICFNPRPSSLRGATVRAQQAVFTEILVRLTRTGARTCFRASIGFPIGLRRPDNSLTYRPREHPRKLTIARGSRNRART